MIASRPKIVLGFLLTLLAGCGSAASATGVVTYEGTPIEKGYITFFPEGAHGQTAAGPIDGGRFRVDSLVPGPYLVEIAAQKKIDFAVSSAEMQARFKEAKSKGNVTGIIESADLVPPNAVGNRKILTVAAGQQSFEFHLKKPAKNNE